jgi:hypothetical protein
MVYFMPIWNILWSFGIYSPVLVYYLKKNLAALVSKLDRIRRRHTYEQKETKTKKVKKIFAGKKKRKFDFWDAVKPGEEFSVFSGFFQALQL